MANVKRFYWFKLKDDFFRQLHVKKLRKLAGGDTYTIIYLKMLLLSINNGGYIAYNCEDNEFFENLALEIDEEEDNVKVAVNFLLHCNILEKSDNNIFIPEVPESVGSETNYAEKMRRSRDANRGNNVTPVLPQCYPSVTPALPQCYPSVTKCYRDIDIDKEIDKDINNNICDTALAVVDNTPPLRTPKGGNATKKKNFVKPTIEEVIDYCKQRKNNVDSQKWYDYYESNGWKVGRNSMKDWKASIRLWERNGYSAPSGAKTKNDFKSYDYSVSPFEEYENFFFNEKAESGDKNDK